MAKLWDKYLVMRRDGTVPDWPYLVMSAADPAVPAALQAYAEKAISLGMEEDYVADILALAQSFEDWRAVPDHRMGDPDAPAHRKDNPMVTSKIKAGSTPDGWKHPPVVDDRPHSRACGIRKHGHGPDCSSNCPTCGGR